MPSGGARLVLQGRGAPDWLASTARTHHREVPSEVWEAEEKTLLFHSDHWLQGVAGDSMVTS